MTTVILYRSGNAGGPRLDNVRDADVSTFDVGGVQWVRGRVLGISTNSDRALVNPTRWRLAAGSAIDPDLFVFNDEGTHYAWQPTRDMTRAAYTAALARNGTVPPWVRDANVPALVHSAAVLNHPSKLISFVLAAIEEFKHDIADKSDLEPSLLPAAWTLHAVQESISASGKVSQLSRSNQAGQLFAAALTAKIQALEKSAAVSDEDTASDHYNDAAVLKSALKAISD